MEIISSLENKKIKNLSKLLLKKYRDSEGKFLIDGEHLVQEAYKKGLLLEVIMTEECPCKFDVPVIYVTYEVLKKLSNATNPQKVVGVCRKFNNEKAIGNKVLILDDLQDPGNLGTIIRSSVAFGVDTIVMSLNTVDLYNDKVIRASEGMIFHIDIVKKDLPDFVKQMIEKGYNIYGTKVDGGTEVQKIDFGTKVGFIVGNEGAGVKAELLDLCHDYIYIPMSERCESLNVGVATSIILYVMSNK